MLGAELLGSRLVIAVHYCTASLIFAHSESQGLFFFYLSGSFALAVILEVMLLAEALGLDWFTAVTVHLFPFFAV